MQWYDRAVPGPWFSLRHNYAMSNMITVHQIMSVSVYQVSDYVYQFLLTGVVGATATDSCFMLTLSNTGSYSLGVWPFITLS